MNTISMDKKYTTRSGLPVRILCVDRNDPYYPVVGLANGFVATWTEHGAHAIGQVNDSDLVEVKGKKKEYLVCRITEEGRLYIRHNIDSQQVANTLMLSYKKDCPDDKWFIHEIEYEV